MNAPENRPLVFALGGSMTGDEPGILGLWTVTAAPSGGGLAFSAEPAAQVGSAVVWQVDLPASFEEAMGRLGAAEANLSASPWAMAQAQARMDAYTAQLSIPSATPRPVRTPRQVEDSGVPNLFGQFSGQRQAVTAFSFGPSRGAGLAEQEMDRLLLEIALAQGPASYGLGEAVGGKLASAAEQFQAFLDRLAQQLGNTAWVETRSQGQLLACTVVGWTGDARTHWLESIAPSRMAMHRRTVALALGSRLRLLEILAFVSRNAVRLARLPMLLAVPGGAILALPLAWKFVNDVRRELE